MWTKSADVIGYSFLHIRARKRRFLYPGCELFGRLDIYEVLLIRAVSPRQRFSDTNFVESVAAAAGETGSLKYLRNGLCI